jgi:hypothetical protein
MPRGLRHDLTGHQVQTVQDLGFAGLSNGALLRQATAAGIEVFLTVDRGIEHQLHIPAIPIAVIALRARSNDIADLRPLMRAVIESVSKAPAGRVTQIPS